MTTLIFCPTCQRQLRLPVEFTGRQVRCPSCQNVFVAGGQDTSPIQAKLPAFPPMSSEPPLPLPEQRDRRDEEGGVDEDRDIRRSDDARPIARRGARFLALAGAITLLTRMIGLISQFFIDIPAPQGVDDIGFRIGQGAGAVGCGVVVVTFAVFMFLGSNALANLRSHGLAMSACVLCFVEAGLILFTWIGCNAIGLSALPIGVDIQGLRTVVLVQMACGGLNFATNLLAGIMGLVSLNNADVRDAMKPRERNRRRRRRRRDDDWD